jgi:DNA-binding transcriptional LysR family regulator
MEFRNLHTFLVAADLKNFTKAALRLGYTQSTVTAQIQQLERELGMPLFDRINHSIALTHYGEALLPLVKAMENLESEIKSLNNTNEATIGNLKLAIPESTIYAGFLRICAEFHKIFPKVKLDITTASSYELVSKIMVNDVDFILTLSDVSPFNDLTKIFSVDTQLVFVTNSKNEILKNKLVPLSKVASQDLVFTEDMSVYYKKVMGLFHEKGLFPRPIMQLKNTRAIVEYIKHNDCISFLPKYCVENEVEKGTIGILNVNVKPMTMSISGVINRHKWLSPQLSTLIKLVNNGNWLKV